jgi:methylenetetrahydrofolate dehydrogenase (NADP+)/methenyltetrahydrofolate cyclohydrolase
MLHTMPTILDGKKVADSVYAKLELDISLLSIVPKLTVLLVGNDPASETYVRAKTKKASDLGLRSNTIQLPDTVSEDEVLRTIANLNEDRDVHGILVQLPLPGTINRRKILHALSPLKDVDGLHPENAGRLFEGAPRFVPCTPAGILEMLRYYRIPLEGKKVVVLGRSEIVGKPVASLLLAQNATITICHSKTRHLSAETTTAEILIAAVGKPKFVTDDFVSHGAIVIDVGIHRTEHGLVGDVDFESVSKKASAISPVPGGVGPLTIAMLIKNLVYSAHPHK